MGLIHLAQDELEGLFGEFSFYDLAQWLDMRYPNVSGLLNSILPPLFLLFGGGIILQFWPWDGGWNEIWNGTGVWYANQSWVFQWQRITGFNDVYDWFFKVGASCEKAKFKFKHGPLWYTLWCWKGNYWNLGVGAEIGLYWAFWQHAFHWQTVVSSEFLTVDMKIMLEGNEIYPAPYPSAPSTLTNWWVCVFLPEYQHRKVKDVGVFAKIEFGASGMISSFATAVPSFKDDRISVANGIAIFDWYAGSTA